MAILPLGISNYLLNELGVSLANECDQVRIYFTDGTNLAQVVTYSNTNGVVTKSATTTISNIPSGKTPSRFQITDGAGVVVSEFEITNAVTLTGEGEAQFGAHTLTVTG